MKEKILAAGGGALAAILLGIWFLGQIPGYYTYDTFKNVYRFYEGGIDDRCSAFYPYYLGLLSATDGDLTFLGIFRILAISLALAAVLYWSWKKGAGKALTALCLTLFLLCPLNYIYSFFYTRDIEFSWCFAFLMTLIFSFLLRHRREKARTITPLLTAIGLVTILVASLRPESALYLVLVPAALFFRTDFPRKKWIWLMTAFAVLAAGYIFALPKALGIKSVAAHNSLTAVVSPLAYIFRKSENLPLSDFEREGITNLVSIKDLKADDTILASSIYNKGVISFDRTPEDYHRFLLASLSVIARNPLLYLENRLEILPYQIGWEPIAVSWDNLTDPSNTSKYRVKYAALTKRPVSESLRAWEDNLSEAIYAIPLARLLWFSMIPSLLVFVTIFFLWRKFPVTALVCALVMARSVLMIFLISDVCFSYLYNQYLLTFLIPVFCQIEARTQNEPRKV